MIASTSESAALYSGAAVASSTDSGSDGGHFWAASLNVPSAVLEAASNGESAFVELVEEERSPSVSFLLRFVSRQSSFVVSGFLLPGTVSDVVESAEEPSGVCSAGLTLKLDAEPAAVSGFSS